MAPQRCNQATQQHVDVDCPQVIAEYNQLMCGVDKLNFLMSLYPLPVKVTKWPVRMISHFIGFAQCCSWLEYIRDANADGLPPKKMKDVMAFQSDIAHSLIASNWAAPTKRGRLSTTSPKPVQ
ncbi:hypothetical protein HPB48_003876 [Haemaphysalis longicornis]|uniref:PiggyBac transposable element-derived protein domain-containing protein n=1 Tax=Haemaphysalis longicornis TaxID=44386 RepID=A0A9J6FEJ4_HAELO|nr:hypothetical protein HPB48_003876 [Haemaphysalis longicornis]